MIIGCMLLLFKENCIIMSFGLFATGLW